MCRTDPCWLAAHFAKYGNLHSDHVNQALPLPFHAKQIPTLDNVLLVAPNSVDHPHRTRLTLNAFCQLSFISAKDTFGLAPTLCFTPYASRPALMASWKPSISSLFSGSNARPRRKRSRGFLELQHRPLRRSFSIACLAKLKRNND